MTEIHELLRRAADVPIVVDVAGDVQRGRAYVRRRRIRLASLIGGGVLGVGVLAGAGYLLLPGGDDATVIATEGPGKDPTRHPTRHHPKGDTSAEPTPHRTIHAASVDPATLVHTPYFDVPPAPEGWHLVGATPFYVMIAPDGTDPALEGGFERQLMVMMDSAFDPTGIGVTPLDFDDRTFFMIDGAGLTRIAVKDRAGDWVVAQYPESAGFQTPDMVAYLDAVRPLAGSMSAR